MRRHEQKSRCTCATSRGAQSSFLSQPHDTAHTNDLCAQNQSETKTPQLDLTLSLKNRSKRSLVHHRVAHWTNLNINLNSILITIRLSSSSVHRALCKLVASCHKYNTCSELTSERRAFSSDQTDHRSVLACGQQKWRVRIRKRAWITLTTEVFPAGDRGRYGC